VSERAEGRSKAEAAALLTAASAIARTGGRGSSRVLPRLQQKLSIFCLSCVCVERAELLLLLLDAYLETCRSVTLKRQRLSLAVGASYQFF
jgi:DNA-binding MurR/RpiR family transcriptional regulator